MGQKRLLISLLPVPNARAIHMSHNQNQQQMDEINFLLFPSPRLDTCHARTHTQWKVLRLLHTAHTSVPMLCHQVVRGIRKQDAREWDSEKKSKKEIHSSGRTYASSGAKNSVFCFIEFSQSHSSSSSPLSFVQSGNFLFHGDVHHRFD